MNRHKNVDKPKKTVQQKNMKRISIKKPSTNILLVFGILLTLTLLILLPILLKDGYFARLDGLVTPNPRTISSNSWFFTIPLLSQIATLIMPMHIFWKISVIFFFLLLGYSGYKLVKNDINTIYPIGFAISLMMINPFVYGRFIDGQMNVYWMVAIVPFWLLLLRTYFQNNNIKNKNKNFPRKTLFALILLSVVWIGTSLHAIFMIGLSVFVFTLVYLPVWAQKTIHKEDVINKSISQHSKIALATSTSYTHTIKIRFWKIVALGVGIGVGSSYLIYMLFKPSTGRSVASFVKDSIDADHLAVFATGWKTLGVVGNILSLRGYRGERTGRFFPNYGENSVRFLLAGALFLLVLIGWIYYLKTKKTQIERNWQIAFTITAVFAVILGMGTGQQVPDLFSQINNWLFQNVPYYTGMREPQKRIVFLIPFYAYFGSFGLIACGKGFAYLWKKITKQTKESTSNKIGTSLLLLLLAVIPSAYSYMMFWGFHGQIKMIQYPSDWYTLKDILKGSKANKENDCPAYKSGQTTSCYDILNLPWHNYIGIGWVGGIVLNPMPAFFDTIKVLTAHNVEIGPIYTQSQIPEFNSMDSYLGPKGYFWNKTLDEQVMHNFINILKGMGVKQIFIIKQSHYQNLIRVFNMFLKMKAIRILHDSPTTSLFEII